MGDGGQQGGPERPGARQGYHKQPRKEDQPDPKVRGHYPQHGLGDFLNGRRTVEPENGKAQVVEGWAVVLEGVVGVGALFQQFTRLDGLIGLVAVHRAIPQIVEAEKGGRTEDE